MWATASGGFMDKNANDLVPCQLGLHQHLHNKQSSSRIKQKEMKDDKNNIKSLRSNSWVASRQGVLSAAVLSGLLGSHVLKI